MFPSRNTALSPSDGRILEACRPSRNSKALRLCPVRDGHEEAAGARTAMAALQAKACDLQRVVAALDMLSSRECTAGTLVCMFSGCFSCCNALQDIICGDGEHEDAGADGARW